MVKRNSDDRVDYDFKKDAILSNIFPYIKDKTVLDVGCVEHNIENMNKDRIWVHGFLKKWSKSLKGIDILKADILKLKKMKYDVYLKSAEDFNFKNLKFDVIFAGELIEHLSNPGLFLQRCRKHLKRNGKLILTTPNAFCVYRLLYILKNFSNDPIVNDEHTCWYSPKVIKQLLQRYDFEIEKMIFVDYPLIKKSMHLKHKIVRFFEGFGDTKFKDTMLIVTKLK
jgi:2-polyprenyl-3-methyl-5-hydroxy-6-metoxy-1,4-benzoquinol methylase